MIETLELKLKEVNEAIEASKIKLKINLKEKSELEKQHKQLLDRQHGIVNAINTLKELDV